MKFYFCADGGAVEGPMELDEIAEMFRNGRMPKLTQVCEESQNTWQPIEEVLPPAMSSEPPVAKPIPRAKKVLESTTYEGGLESVLDWFAGIFAVLGSIGIIVCFVMAKATEQYAFWVIVGIAAVIQGFALMALFECGGEIIRLLKKSNGLKYSGAITTPTANHSYQCSACKRPVSENHCYGCQTELAS